MNFYIGDLHLGHLNCLAFDDRPFLTLDEQDEFIISAWNKRVGQDDKVYIVGDVSFYSVDKTVEILKRLNGKLYLAIGNHDKKLLRSKEFRDCFEEINKDFTLNLGDNKSLYISHFPSPCFDKHYYGSYHFYAHVHASFEFNMMKRIRRQMEALYTKPHNMFNVGAMLTYMDYTPRTFDEIILYSAENGSSIGVSEDSIARQEALIDKSMTIDAKAGKLFHSAGNSAFECETKLRFRINQLSKLVQKLQVENYELKTSLSKYKKEDGTEQPKV